ncbi:hypothetical protein B484DRAFT_395391 [Ochromonadaceae sp. CCMP2298]|nr:hypothetical protein B484DRAFT_395391 [Ochromonadaceae sp. CCMP2298]|mmetsp:Transcript_17977/g.39163  ORF Transcript_17977/g.39163 Transcript_17977/m.39163 type:complete len:578 (+) Transcript_17977:67-1800(+)
MSAETVAKSIGHHGHWGFSAGFDFLEALPDALSAQTTNPKEVNILLVNPGDIRHILFTISRRRRHKTANAGELPRINFYLLETPVELLSRELLLLQVLTDFEVPIRQRANVYLEIFGNIKVQKRTSKYIEALGRQLKQLSAKGVGSLDQLVDFGMLNYRERDQFELCLDGYAHAFSFDMGALYDQRQRGLYAERFDARKGLSDWDYQAGIKSTASIVHAKQYREWRNTGLAYEFGDQTYSEPNRTLMTYTEGFMKKGKEKGMKKEVKGFWGDIVSSPYFAIGVDSDTPNKLAEGLYEIINKNTGTEQHRHHAVEISLYNLYSVLWEIETGAVYKMTKANDIYSGLGQQDKLLQAMEQEEVEAVLQQEAEAGPQKVLLEAIAEEAEEAEREEGDKKGAMPPPPPSVAEADPSWEQLPTPPAASTSTTAATSAPAASVDAEKRRKKEATLVRAIQRAETIAESYHNVKIYPMTGTLSGLLGKSKFRDTFYGVFVSSRSAQILQDKEFASVCRSGAVVAVETAKFLVPLGRDVKAAMTLKEQELAAELGFRCIPPPVPRRRRDEKDFEDDVVFFTRGKAV